MQKVSIGVGLAMLLGLGLCLGQAFWGQQTEPGGPVAALVQSDGGQDAANDQDVVMPDPLAAYPKRLVVTDPYSLHDFVFVLVEGQKSGPAPTQATGSNPATGSNEDTASNRGQPPLYVMVTEVTWGQFLPWVYGDDLSPEEHRKAIELGLRMSPSRAMNLFWGQENLERPVCGLRVRTAHLFSKTMADRTALPIRLPAEAEWEHVFVTTQGPLDQVPENINAIAANDASSDFELMPVASFQANGHGIHDLLGNASEWVRLDASQGLDANGQPLVAGVLRGGSFWSMPDELSGSARQVPDEAAWTASEPNFPKNQWWYWDRVDGGFRLVCEATPEVLAWVESTGESAEAKP